jgi:phosphatidylglycerol---prolipoprotein diacylglyceryl transferase
MHPILCDIFGLKLYSYGFFMAVGVFAAVAVALYLARTSDVKTDTIYDLSFVIVIFSIIGARILYVLINLSYYLSHPFEIILLNRGGLVFYGGLFGGFIAALIYMKKNALPAWKLGDILCVVVPLGQAFGRIGCFMNSCCFGKACTASWSVTFPINSLPFEHYQDFVPVHPVQLYESGAVFLVFVMLYVLYEDKKFDGQIVSLYGAFYSLARFSTEFFRGDVPVYFSLTLAQWISAGVFVFSVFLYRKLSRRGIIPSLQEEEKNGEKEL